VAKILIAVLGLAGILAAAHYGLQSRAPTPESQPHRQLQNVREAAGRIEQEAQQRADDALERTGEQAPE
jgi:hypothetical protein